MLSCSPASPLLLLASVCVCQCARAVSVVRVVCVRARAIAGAVERGAHLSARRMEMCVPVSSFLPTVHTAYTHTAHELYLLELMQQPGQSQ